MYRAPSSRFLSQPALTVQDDLEATLAGSSRPLQQRMQRTSFDSMQRAPAYQQSEFEYQQQLHFQQQQQQQSQQQHYRGAPYGGMHQEPNAYQHQYHHQANASRFDPSSPHGGLGSTAGSNYGSGAESQNEDASFNASSADLDSIGRRFDESERRHAQLQQEQHQFQQQQRHHAADHVPARAASGRRVDMNASRESWERDMDSVCANHPCNIMLLCYQ